MTSKNLIWLRGEFVSEENAHVSVLSGMAQFGLNVFEGIRVYKSQDGNKLHAFRLDDHLERLSRSCKLIGLNLPEPLNDIAQHFHDTITRNGFADDVAVRLTVFVDGVGSWNSSSPVSYFIAPIEKYRTNLASLRGYSASISSWVRIADNALPPRAKIGANYINGRFALLTANAAGYDFPILLNQKGEVSESSGSCIFFVAGNFLITPTTTSSILESITRSTIIKLASELGLPTEERSVDRTELLVADEVFLCGTAAEIIPITRIDQFKIGHGEVGAITRKLLMKYHELVSGVARHNKDWLTEIK